MLLVEGDQNTLSTEKHPWRISGECLLSTEGASVKQRLFLCNQIFDTAGSSRS